MQSEEEDDDEEEKDGDGDEYMRDHEEKDASNGRKGKGRQRRVSLSGTPRGGVSPKKVGGDTGGRDERGKLCFFLSFLFR